MMKKFICLLTFLFIFAGLLLGCKQKENTQAHQPAEPVTIKFGHVGHDHHTALFVAFDNAAEYAKESGISVKVIEDRKSYELFDKGQKVANVEIVKVGGGSKMPTALAQGIIDIGFGGAAPTLACADGKAPVKLISPLHSKGDMFVVRPDSPIKTWDDFVRLAKSTDKPLRVGYKSPMAVAKLILEEALTHEGISYSGDLTRSDVKVHLINTKGGSKLNVSLGADLIDAYVGNNPFPSIAIEKKIGRIVCDLEDLPPGTFRDHPCCCIAANTRAIEEKSEAIVDLLVLFLQANETINSDLDKTVACTVRWIGTSESVERMSIPTSGYSMEPSAQWHQTMDKWIEAMNGLGIFRDKLKELEYEKVVQAAYDLSLLDKARKKLAQRRAEK